MKTVQKLATCCLVISLVSVTGCSNTALWRDSRDAPWDPPQGRLLFEQIPSWDRSVDRCCGHLRECQPYQTRRC
jgi:hypothetical protein